MYNNMKSEQIIIIGVGIASMLFAYLLNGNIREGITNKQDNSNTLMVREQIKKLDEASALIKKNNKIDNKTKKTMNRNLDAMRKQLGDWYKDHTSGLKKSSVARLKNIWSKNKVLVTGSDFDDLDVIDDNQAYISRLLKSVKKNMDSIE